MVLGVVAENSLPLTMSPVIIDLAKELARDRLALQDLSMDRTSASYTLTHGVKKTILNTLLDEMKAQPFSLNIDEATTKTNIRVLGVLVSYWSTALEKMVVEHLAAIELTTVNANTIFMAMDKLFTKNGIPWTNLISIMMDSCAVMRGSKNGFETKVREQRAEHLLDIDGDSCHHIHNASKRLTGPFEGWVDGLLNDLHIDHKWSVDMRERLSEICGLMGVSFSRPERYVPHRWLSVCDVSLDTLRLWNCYVLFYYAFLKKEERETYKEVVLDIVSESEMEEAGRKRLRSLWRELEEKAKNFTDEGKKRKSRIVRKVLYEERKTKLELNFFVSVLPLLKDYVLLFQTKNPMIHKLHDEQERVFSDFLACCVKPETLVDKYGKNLSGPKMKKIDLTGDHRLPHPFVGREAKKTLEALHSDDRLVVDFTEKVKKAYEDCATYLQKKLPLDSKVLRALSCLDPDIRGNSRTLELLEGLIDLLPKGFLTSQEMNAFSTEVQKYASDMRLPDFHDRCRVDVWWTAVKNAGRFPVLSKVALALLSCFHGPQIESSFNVMGDILHVKTANTSVETYESYQMVKYHLRNAGKSAIQFFHRPDRKTSPVDIALCGNIKTSSFRYRKQLKDRRSERERQAAEVKRKVQKVTAKKTWKEMMEEKLKKSRKEFKDKKQERVLALKRLSKAKKSQNKH